MFNSEAEFVNVLKASELVSSKLPPRTTITFNEESMTVDVYLDTKATCFLEWAEGEGPDFGILREVGTNKLMGCRLPIYHSGMSLLTVSRHVKEAE